MCVNHTKRPITSKTLKENVFSIHCVNHTKRPITSKTLDKR